MAEATLDQPQETCLWRRNRSGFRHSTPFELTDQLPEAVDNRTGLSKIITDFDQPVVKQALPAIILVTVIAMFFVCCIFGADI